jgi:UDP-glucose 4-epimerase
LKKPEIINKNTVPYPKNYYGLSKLLAENAITKLSSLNFAVSIFRSPIIYGNKAKGNFNKLLKFILNYRFFPDINNQRSMLYVDNLCIFFREVIDKQLSGVFFPQNSDYINSTQIAKIASNITNKKILITKIFNPIIKNLNFSLFNKLFGTLIIDKSLNIQVNLNNQISLYQSLLQTLDYKNE